MKKKNRNVLIALALIALFVFRKPKAANDTAGQPYMGGPPL